MTSLNEYLHSNQQLLTQLQKQLQSLLDNFRKGDLFDSGESELFQKQNKEMAIYSATIPVIGGASTGAHLRHILDFYQSFYRGAKDGHIDYDNRQRNIKIEQRIDAGLDKIRDALEQLEQLKFSENRAVSVNTAVTVKEFQSPDQPNSSSSNLIRELQFLHSHTTHHMAIIGIILQLNNIDVDENFGKAPSTIQYERQQSTVLIQEQNSGSVTQSSISR